MDWLSLSLASALVSATEAAGMKKLFPRLTPYEMGLAPMLYAQPLCLAVLALARPPVPPPGFWLDTALLMPFSFAGYLLYCQAIRLSPLSLTLPYLALTPALAMLTGSLLLGEVPNAAGAAMGLIHFAHIAVNASAIVLTKAAYMLAIKRLDGLFGVILGRAAFQEEDFPARLAGAGLMAAGVAVIAVFGR